MANFAKGPQMIYDTATRANEAIGLATSPRGVNLD